MRAEEHRKSLAAEAAASRLANEEPDDSQQLNSRVNGPLVFQSQRFRPILWRLSFRKTVLRCELWRLAVLWLSQLSAAASTGDAMAVHLWPSPRGLGSKPTDRAIPSLAPQLRPSLWPEPLTPRWLPQHAARPASYVLPRRPPRGHSALREETPCKHTLELSHDPDPNASRSFHFPRRDAPIKLHQARGRIPAGHVHHHICDLPGDPPERQPDDRRAAENAVSMKEASSSPPSAITT